MVNTTGFAQFQPKYKSTVADALYNVTNSIQASNRKLHVKWLIATYFSMANLKEIETKGVKFRFIQHTDASYVEINGKSMPIQDINEGFLYRILFDQFMTDTYSFQVKSKNLTKVIANLGRHFTPYIQFNGKFGVFTLRQLRAYALIHDYGISEVSIKRIFGFKTWVFKEVELTKALEMVAKANKGIKLNPGII